MATNPNFNLFDFGASPEQSLRAKMDPLGAAIARTAPKQTVSRAGVAVPAPYADLPSYRKARSTQDLVPSLSSPTWTRSKFVSENEFLEIASQVSKEMRGEVIQGIIDRGYMIEGINDSQTAIGGQVQESMKAEVTPESVQKYRYEQQDAQENERGFMGRLNDNLAQAWDNSVKVGLEGIGLNDSERSAWDIGGRGLDVLYGAATAVPSAVGALAKTWIQEIPAEYRDRFGKAAVEAATNALPYGAKETGEALSDAYGYIKQVNPAGTKGFERSLGILGGAADTALIGKAAIAAPGIATKGAKATAQAVGNAGESIIARRAASRIAKEAAWEAKAAERITGKLVDASIGGEIVRIPQPKTGIVRKTIESVSKDDTRSLAGRAIMPSYAGKTPKQVVRMAEDLEKRTRSFHEMARTGRIKDADISTLQDAARTAVNGIDEIGEKIGNAVKGANVSFEFPKDVLSRMKSQLSDPIDAGLEANNKLKTMVSKVEATLKDGKVSVQDAFRLKKALKDDMETLIRSGQTSSESYVAFRDGMESIVNGIDDAVAKAPGGSEFQALKKDYGTLKSIVKDMAKSATVEWRKAPMSFVEQMSFVQSLPDLATRPLATAGAMARQKVAKELAEMNSRGGAWERLINKYDQEAIRSARNAKLVPKATPKAPNAPKPASRVLVPKK